MKRVLLSLLIIAFSYFSSLAQGDSCRQATSVLIGNLNTYPAGVNSGSAEVGADYGCLGSQPNPVWYCLHVGNSGTIGIEMHSTPQVDIDFACWGPFTDPVSPCVAQLTASTLIDCSYSASWTEICDLPNATSGQYYLLMITNFSNSSCNITFSQTTGNGALIYASSISGSIFNDVNENGIKDIGEDSLIGTKVKLINKNIVHLSQSDGNYYFACDSGTQQIQCLPMTYWDFTTDSILNVYVPDSSTHVGNNNFGIKLQGASSDVSVDITGNTAIINDNVNYWLTYRNEAALPKSGAVVLTIDPLTTFVSSSPPPDVQSGNVITWNYSNLVSQETRQINLILLMPGVAFLNDTMLTTAIINPIPGDMYLPNNYDTLRQRMYGSFDPNDKTVDKGVGSQGYTFFGTDLEYTIHFQNTGTAPASRVEIVDTIDNNLDIQSFCLVSSSHNVSVEITDSNELIFLFSNIQLPDSGVSQSASCGFVKFAIKPKEGLAENTHVVNSAGIYFDANPAVVTNQTLNTYVSNIIITDIGTMASRDETIHIFPNPSPGLINITFAQSVKNTKIDVLTSSGQLIYSKNINNQTSSSVDLSNFVKGLYFIKVQTGNGVVVRKVVISE
ncbi:MAG: T9SS type A sorting domain-containing protein [Bacillota bacterium]